MTSDNKGRHLTLHRSRFKLDERIHPLSLSGIAMLSFFRSGTQLL